MPLRSEKYKKSDIPTAEFRNSVVHKIVGTEKVDAVGITISIEVIVSHSANMFFCKAPEAMIVSMLAMRNLVVGVMLAHSTVYV